jgi:hypothetical protein
MLQVQRNRAADWYKEILLWVKNFLRSEYGITSDQYEESKPAPVKKVVVPKEQIIDILDE